MCQCVIVPNRICDGMIDYFQYNFGIVECLLNILIYLIEQSLVYFIYQTIIRSQSINPSQCHTLPNIHLEFGKYGGN